MILASDVIYEILIVALSVVVTLPKFYSLTNLTRGVVSLVYVVYLYKNLSAGM